MKKIFLSFADSNMFRSLRRIHEQACGMNFYDHVLTLDESSLEINYKDKYKDKLIIGSRGFGYWCWKPQIILQILDQLEDGDVLQYTDAGCHLNSKGIHRLNEYFHLASGSKTGILAFQAIPPSFHTKHVRLPDLTEKKWSKGDLFDYFSCRNDVDIINTPQYGAGVIFITKCSNSTKIIKEWISVYQHAFPLLDDTPSKSLNDEGFVEHRHDQSIFSIICKLNKVETVSAYEYWYPKKYMPLFPDWNMLKNYPVHVRRDKGLHPLLRPYGLLLRVAKRIRLELLKLGK